MTLADEDWQRSGRGTYLFDVVISTKTRSPLLAASRVDHDASFVYMLMSIVIRWL